MPVRDRDADFLVEQHLGARRDLVPGDGAVEQQVAALGRAADAEIRVAVLGRESGQNVAQPLDAGQCADAQTAGAVQALLDLAPRVQLRIQNGSGVPQQDISLFGASESFSRPFEQLRTQLALQISYRLGYCRLRHAEALCGARHIFGLCDRCKLPKLVNFHAFSSHFIILTGFLYL